jgi:hypothetical protein
MGTKESLSGLGGKEDKKGWMGEGFGRTLNTPIWPFRVLVQRPQGTATGFDWRSTKLNQIRNTVKVD